MQETRKALIKDGWVVCSKCGHKLGRVIEGQLPKGLEIKCHSCKEINLIGCSKCKSFKPKEEYKENYKELKI